MIYMHSWLLQLVTYGGFKRIPRAYPINPNACKMNSNSCQLIERHNSLLFMKQFFPSSISVWASSQQPFFPRTAKSWRSVFNSIQFNMRKSSNDARRTLLCIQFKRVFYWTAMGGVYWRNIIRPCTFIRTVLQVLFISSFVRSFNLAPRVFTLVAFFVSNNLKLTFEPL